MTVSLAGCTISFTSGRQRHPTFTRFPMQWLSSRSKTLNLSWQPASIATVAEHEDRHVQETISVSIAPNPRRMVRCYSSFPLHLSSETGMPNLIASCSLILRDSPSHVDPMTVHGEPDFSCDTRRPDHQVKKSHFKTTALALMVRLIIE